MGEIRKINPYDFSTVPVDQAVKAPPEVMNFIGKCPSVYTDMTPEEAKRLRLENVAILNEIVNDVTVSATCRVQAIQAREKILKDLMGTASINQRSAADLISLLSDDESGEMEIGNNSDSDETDSDGQVSIEDIRKQMLEDEEE